MRDGISLNEKAQPPVALKFGEFIRPGDEPPKIPWVYKGLLARGALTRLERGGLTGGGIIAAEMAACAATMMPYNRVTPAENGPWRSLLIDMRASRRELLIRFTRACHRAGIDPERAAAKVAWLGRGELESPTEKKSGCLERPFLSEIKQLVRRNQIGLLAIGIRWLCDSDVYEELETVAASTGCAILAFYNSTKEVDAEPGGRPVWYLNRFNKRAGLN
jgi:hypothetical protein